MDGGRSVSAAATPQQRWWFYLRSLLRAGDIAAFQEELDKAAIDRPLDALAALREFGYMENAMKDCRKDDLSLWLHFSETARTAARHLPWAAPESVAAMNGVLLDSPWGAYLSFQVGQRPLAEIYAEAQRETRTNFFNTEFGPSSSEWVGAAVSADPGSMIPLLTGPASGDDPLWSQYFSALLRIDPSGRKALDMAE